MPSRGTPSGATLHGAVVLVDIVGCVAVAAAALTIRPGMDATGWYPLKAVAIFSLVMLIVLARIAGTHPFATLGAANHVTAVRAMLVSLVGGLAGEPVGASAGLCAALTSVLVTVLDGVDGWVARRSGMSSRFGARFDMEVDALFILALSMLAWQLGKAGAWVMLAGLLRYVFVAAGWLAPTLAAPLPPSRRRQAICVVQIVGLSVVLLPVVVPPASAWLSAALLLTLVVSFTIDVHWLWQR